LRDDLTGLATIGFAEKLRFLREPSSYPHGPEDVTALETHMSWIFLAGAFAFKLKKPVSYEFLDFTTLGRREFACREEVRLNARLAPGVYLGAVPLRLGGAGQLTLEGGGKVVEWLVKMKRLPASRMLDWLIERGTVPEQEVDAAARHLISFYQTAEPVNQSSDQVWQRFAAEHSRDAGVLGNPRFHIDHQQVARVLEDMKTALGAVRPLLQTRSAQNIYVEGHGDLRPEHICLLPEPVIIDCLEFSRELRILDPFDEIAYLDLECDRLGAAWIGQRVLSLCQRELAQPPPPALLQFYRAARALLRARLALAHVTEPAPRLPKKWEPRARHYIALAEAALHEVTPLRPRPRHAR